MLFLNPFAFWGLLFLSVPIIVHFFDFRNVRRVRFSNVSFLRFVTSQNTARSTLKELLLLFARCLAIVALVLVFARPVLNSGNRVSLGQELIVIDNSYSSAVDCNGVSCLDVAKSVVVDLSQETGRAEVFYGGLRRSNVFYDSDELVSVLQSLDFNKSRLIWPELDDFVSRYTILSDFQPSTLDLVKQNQFDSAEYILLPIANDDLPNLFVDTVYVINHFSFGTNRQSVAVVVFNSGKKNVENSLVRLLNGNMQVSSAAIDIEAEESELITFEVDVSNQQIFEIRLEDNALALDNRFFFKVPVMDKLSISIVAGDENRNIESVFQNDQYFDLFSYSEETVDFDRVFDADLVVIHSFDELPNWVDLDRMKGSVVIFPTERIDLGSYSSLIGVNVRRASDSTKMELTIEVLRHPFYKGIFDKLDSKATLPEVQALYELSGVHDELLRTKGSFLQRMDTNGKAIYWFGSPMSRPYSSLQDHSLFVPLMYRIAEQSIAVDRPLYHRLTDRSLMLAIPQRGRELMQLRGRDGEFVPEVYPNQSEVSLTLPNELNLPGHYYLISNGDTLDILALNIPTEESRMNMIGADELREIFASNPNVTVLDTESMESLKAEFREMKDGTPIWKYALLLALMFLVAEIAIHRWLK